MKLSVSQISDLDIPPEVDPQVISRVLAPASTNLAATLQVLGLSDITLGVVKSFTTNTHSVSSYSFFDGVPDQLKVIANNALDGIAKYMSAFCIGQMSMTLDEGDLQNIKILWDSVINGQEISEVEEQSKIPVKNSEPVFEAQVDLKDDTPESSVEPKESKESDKIVSPGPIIKFNSSQSGQSCQSNKGRCCSKTSCSASSVRPVNTNTIKL